MTVRPGDLIVADNDEVAVVPIEIADQASDRAARIQAVDRPGRRNGYLKLGLPFDETVA